MELEVVMSNLRKAAQQALEALQGIYIAPEHDHYINAWWPACRDAIPALRAALAQQAEPVDDSQPMSPEQRQRWEELAAMPQQAEPVEPVGAVQLSGVIDGLVVPVVTADLPEGTKLYTAPPKRKPLTDEKISDLWCEVSGTDFVTADTHVFARAVERAHGIGRQSNPQTEDRLARHGIPMPGDNDER